MITLNQRSVLPVVPFRILKSLPTLLVVSNIVLEKYPFYTIKYLVSNRNLVDPFSSICALNFSKEDPTEIHSFEK